MRTVRQAENADVISMARAMNNDFPIKVRQLFQDEVDAACAASRTGTLSFSKFFIVGDLNLNSTC
jgi:hypothetical protein